MRHLCCHLPSYSVIRRFALRPVTEHLKCVHPQTKQTVSRLQKLVSFEGNFRNLRDTLHRCDPPCIPYLGMYLTELSFIEEGTPNFTDDGLLNFAKMRMVGAIAQSAEVRVIDWDWRGADSYVNDRLQLRSNGHSSDRSPVVSHKMTISGKL